MIKEKLSIVTVLAQTYNYILSQLVLPQIENDLDVECLNDFRSIDTLFPILEKSSSDIYFIDLEAFDKEQFYTHLVPSLSNLKQITQKPIIICAREYEQDSKECVQLKEIGIDSILTGNGVTDIKDDLFVVLEHFHLDTTTTNKDVVENIKMKIEQEEQIIEAVHEPIQVINKKTINHIPVIEETQITDNRIYSDSTSLMVIELPECLTSPTRSFKVVGFIGSERGVGTTTQAIHFLLFLQKKHMNVCYIEFNSNGHIKSIVDNYDINQAEDGYIQFRGVDMFYHPNILTKEMLNEYDVVVIDFGCISSNIQDTFIQYTDEIICCCGSKEWQDGNTFSAVNQLNENTLYSFAMTLPKFRLELIKGLNLDVSHVFFPKNTPDVFSYQGRNYLHAVLHKKLTSENRRLLKAPQTNNVRFKKQLG